MTVQSLNGWWDYRIGGGAYKSIKVPYSALPVGKSEYRLRFDRAETSERSFLVFEGITYKAIVALNGRTLGEMLPYCQYKFEITDVMKDKENILSVEIYDIDVVFGPSEGWENYSGIIRGVYIEYTGKNVIADTSWATVFSGGYSKAACVVKAAVDAADNGFSLNAEFTLADPFGDIVFRGAVPVKERFAETAFEIEKPLLWSPDSPYLYTLEVSLLNSDGSQNSAGSAEKVGFKDFTVKGKRFYLNGEPLFLLGVCRHDTFGDDGHTLTEAEMIKDMKMIKDAGVNYVRLVHYPHNKRILEIADELGLLVSEEPGLWWSDMSNRELCDASLSVLEKTIQRDKNHVSVAFWLSFNECVFTPEFLLDSANVSRKADPTRMVSGANCMDIDMTKEQFSRCGFDFYTMHPYAPTPDRIRESAEKLDDKPLLLTEWGGYHVYQNENSMREFVQTIVEHWKNDESKPMIAGAAIWCWAEIYEFHRGEPACRNGILKEGLVDIYRNPLVNLEIFKQEFAALYEEKPKEYKIEVADYWFEPGDYFAVDLSDVMPGKEWNAAWDAMISNAKKPVERFSYIRKRERNLENGPVLPEEIKNIGVMPVSLEKYPLIISKDKKIIIPIGRTASCVYFFGNASMPKGFPMGGEYGEAVAEYTVVYSDGSRQTRVLRNGEDITTAAAYYGPSRINPLTENAKRAIKYSYDFDWEHYIVNLYYFPADESKEIRNIEIEVKGDGYDLLLYGITLKIL